MTRFTKVSHTDYIISCHIGSFDVNSGLERMTDIFYLETAHVSVSQFLIDYQTLCHVLGTYQQRYTTIQY